MPNKFIANDMTKRQVVSKTATSGHGPLTSQFDELVKRTMEEWKVPGLSIAVVDGNQTWAKGYGLASLPETPVTPSTLFFAGSTTKAFTAAAMALLVEDNDKYPQIQWDTAVNQLIRDDFVLADEYATNHITIEDTLSHRTGLPRHDQSYGHCHQATVKEVVRSLRHLPLTAEPRTKYQYCNLMFVVASHIIETVTGQWLGDFLAERIWRPLGMEGTFFSTDDAKQSRYDLARGYYHDGQQYQQVEWMSLNEVSGAGSVISNVHDYAKWAHAWMTRKLPLSEAAYKALWEPRTLVPMAEPYTGPRAYALGWNTGVYQGHRFYQHAGGMDAFGTELIIFPDLQYSLIAFANTAGSSNIIEEMLLYHLIDEKLRVPAVARYRWGENGRETIEKGKRNVKTARKQFYPSLPSPPLPPSVPFTAYAGTYRHPGYQHLVITLDEADSGSGRSTLRAERADTTWPEHIQFEHVSGEFFLAYADHVGDYGAYFPEVYPVEFRLGADGRPCAVGIRWEQAMKDEKIWLDRVSSS